MPSTSTADELTRRLQETEALREGHFRLSSGLHSARYFQCARLLSQPAHAEWAARALAAEIEAPVTAVVGPAIGGIVIAYELARALGVRALFTERVDGEMALRRGFEVAPGEKVLVVEDVVTTGGSAREAARALEAAGAEVVAFASLVDRSGGNAPFGVPYYALAAYDVVAHAEADCPLCAQGVPVEKPGSRPVGAPP